MRFHERRHVSKEAKDGPPIRQPLDGGKHRFLYGTWQNKRKARQNKVNVRPIPFVQQRLKATCTGLHNIKPVPKSVFQRSHIAFIQFNDQHLCIGVQAVVQLLGKNTRARAQLNDISNALDVQPIEHVAAGL